MQPSIPNDWSRRGILTGLALAPLAASVPERSFAASPGTQISSGEARKRLIAGNGRYVAGKHLRIDHSNRREETAPGQSPFAIVLGCSDSRVPPEILFDQGLGDVFTVRVAGNIADDLTMGSMEYAVSHFATPIIVVLGHERCGAIIATLDAVKTGNMPPPHLTSLVTALRPSVEASKATPGDAVENAVAANIRLTVEALKSSSPILADAVRQGRLEIVGAEYHLGNGRVAFMT
jgi:carbonic anhydrase